MSSPEYYFKALDFKLEARKVMKEIFLVIDSDLLYF